MRTLVWIVTATLIALWSAFAWIVHAVIGVGGGLAAGNADLLPADPELVEWISWAAWAGTSVGEWLVIAVWASVTLVIAGLGLVGATLAPRLATRG